MKNLSAASKKLIMIGAGIIGIFVFVMVGLLIYRAVAGTNLSYERLQTLMEEAGKRYFDVAGLPEEGEKKSVSIEQLSAGKYMKPLEKLTNDTACTGKVIVSNNGGYYLYSPFLNCGKNYITQALKGQVISDNIVTDGEGLYEVGDEYVFKGEFVNNYVLFANQLWRIIKVDPDGNMKLLAKQNENGKEVWDDRYNVNDHDSYGYNDFNVSRIREKLQREYNSSTVYPEESKKYILNYAWCIDKVATADIPLYSDAACTNRSEPQYFGLLSLSDYANASLDTTCTYVSHPQCRNYNYMRNLAPSTWTMTGSTLNSYAVYIMVNGRPDTTIASNMGYYNTVLYLDANTLYKSGTGTQNDPYFVQGTLSK